MASERKKRNRNIFFSIVLFLFIGGYTVFFTSRFWLRIPVRSGNATKIGTTVDWNDREVKLIRWEYSKQQNEMEVELDITNKRYDGINRYKFSAVDLNGNPLYVDKIIEEDDWIVLQIKDLPSRWSDISLRMDMPKESEDTTLKLYSSLQDVKKVGKIEKRSRTEYKVLRCDSQIADYNKKIQKAEQKQGKLNQENLRIDDKIAELKEKETYQTDEEKENTEQLISDAESQKQMNTDEMEELKNKVTEYQQRVSNIEKQKEKIANE